MFKNHSHYQKDNVTDEIYDVRNAGRSLTINSKLKQVLGNLLHFLAYVNNYLYRQWFRTRQFVKQHKLTAVLMTLFLALSILGFALIYYHADVKALKQEEKLFKKELVISFSRPIRPSLSYDSLTPGTWRIIRDWRGVTGLAFLPKNDVYPGQKIVVTIDNIKPNIDISSDTKKRQILEFNFAKPPKISSIMPALGQKNVGTKPTITINLSSKNFNKRELRLVKTNIPITSDEPVSNNDTSFSWQIKGSLEQGRQYVAEVVDLRQPIGKNVVANISFNTVSEPLVIFPDNKVLYPGSNLTVSFSEEMHQVDAPLKADFDFEGHWIDSRTYSISIKRIEPSKSYTLTAKKGLRSVVGGLIYQDKTTNLITNGAVKVISSSPNGQRIALNTPVSISFNQPVNQKSAEVSFIIEPKPEGSFRWNGNTMIFTPNNMSFKTTYSYGVSAGIVPIFGLSGESFRSGFVSLPPSIKLAVPYFSQVHSLSCEMASLRMILAYYGIGSSDDEILQRVGYDPQPRDIANNSWQNPNEMFVGNVDGKMNETGWGVYAEPLAKATRSFGKSADILRSPRVSQLAASLYAGRPSIIWGVSANNADMPGGWNTSKGFVSAARNQHVRTVYGVEGSADSPEGFYIHDPLRKTGSVYWTATQLQRNLDLGGAQALVVY